MRKLRVKRESLLQPTCALLMSVALIASTATFAKKVVVEKSKYGVYTVIMRDAPVLRYNGNLSDYEATAPKGIKKKINKNDPNVKKYVGYLKNKHSQVLQKANITEHVKGSEYTYLLSGFSAALTHNEAKRLAADPDVLRVEPIYELELHSTTIPNQVGLVGDSTPHSFGYTGEGVVIAVMDAGIWPEHPSFADDGSYPAPPAYFNGTACDFGTSTDPVGQLFDAPFECNNKLLSAKYFHETGHLVFGPDLPTIFDDTARSEDGHGTAVSSLAAGNAIPAIAYGSVNLGIMRGTGSRAHLVFYNVDSGALFNGDIWQATEQAIMDGVDLMNKSLGSSESSFATYGEYLDLFAADAGILILQSQGNGGTFPFSSNQRSPWTMGIGGAVKDRVYIGTMVLGNGQRIDGTSVSPAVAQTALVDGGGCTEPELDALGSDIVGSIVVCRDDDPFPPHLRSYSSRSFTHGLEESYLASLRGAAAVVSTIVASDIAPDKLFELRVARENSRITYLPMMDFYGQEAEKLHKYLDKAKKPTAAFEQGGRLKFDGEFAGHIAAGSTRGPSRHMTDIIKPDIAAPGYNRMNVAANVGLGVDPLGYEGLQSYILTNMSGTSSASPIATGVAALVVQAHPDWSPAMVKSALMTSARHDVLADRADPLIPDFEGTVDIVTKPATPFDTGSGIIWAGGRNANDLNNVRGSIIDPGLVYDAGLLEYAAFTCGLSEDLQLFSPGDCNFLASIGLSLDPAQLNYPSIGVSKLAGSKVITRHVTNVAGDPDVTRYHVTVKAPPGMQVEVIPSQLDIPIGGTASYEVHIRNVSAPLGQWVFGSLTWHGKGGYKVRSPIAALPSAIETEVSVRGTGNSGSLEIPVKSGYDGVYSAVPAGLVAPIKAVDTVGDEPNATNCFDLNDIDCLRDKIPLGYVVEHHIVIPAGAKHARFALFDEFTSGNDDLDLFVYNDNDVEVGNSGTFSSAEQVDLVNPEPGTYKVFVHGYDTEGPNTTYTLFSWVVAGDEGNMALSAPSSVGIGDDFNVTVNWMGLIDPEVYLGVVIHENSDGEIARTLITIDNS